MSDERNYAFIERVARFAGALGFNETRVRWRLMRWRDQREAAREQARTAAAHVTYEHAVCGNCGRILPRGTRTCPSCDARLEPRWVQMLRRAGMHAPVPLSVSTFLGALILVAFARQAVGQPSGLMGFDPQELVRLGAHYPALELRGQWWRLGTAVFLHGGVFHLLFNMMALSQIGPYVEDIFRPGRTLFFFVLTGVMANLPTLLMGKFMVGIGASGAIMGFIGLAAGWGQREGTTHGHTVRNFMLKWLLYTTIFGLLVNADHSAHIAGFVSGAVFGFVFHGAGRRRGAADGVFGAIGAIAAVALVLLILFPPAIP